MKVPWAEQEWNRVAVFGLGTSGVAAARLLRKQGVEVIGIDHRDASDLDLAELGRDPGVRTWLGSDLEALPEAVDGLVLSPGVPLQRPLVRLAQSAGIPVIAEVELAFLFVEGRLIGVTGSNGKSTTTRMTGQILSQAGFEVEVCGNIGVPLSAVVEGDPHRIFVTELSSFQLETIHTLRPQAAALLNLSADHLDRHGDMERYLAAKRRLFVNQVATDVAVLNGDDERLAGLELSARRRLFSRSGPVEDGCFLEGEKVVEVEPGGETTVLFDRADLSLPGLHNLENAMAAALLARAMGVEPAVLPAALSRIEGLPHRLQPVADRGGVIWYDDSKATNFAAAAMSMAGFADGSVHLILGGRNKGGDAAELADVVKHKACRLYLVGEAAEEIDRALEDVPVPREHAVTLDIAVVSAARHARPGEVVLLSPACASFDQYRHFGERGDHFQALVRSLDG